MRMIPSVDELLKKEAIAQLSENIAMARIKSSVRETVNTIREEYSKHFNDPNFIPLDDDEIIRRAVSRIQADNESSLKRVINGTGVVLHTNLGRSLLSETVRDTLLDTAFNYSNLEYELKTGERGSRYTHLENAIKDLVKAEDVLVVNNNAAAVMLVLDTMVKGKEAIISRGELVEIGGSFRVPEVLKLSGGELVEVGTTNKTHLYDYENAVTENTGAFLKVHTSNYHIIGFTESVDTKDLVELGKKHDIPVIEDLGSGLFIDLSKYGLSYEPTVQDTLNKGADVVTFSGDKLLGGPQAGIIAGKKKYIEKMKKNQLTRALRVDKMTISALEATLRIYLDEERALKEIPTMRMITMPIEEISEKAEVLQKNLLRKIKTASIEIEETYGQVGGGSMPQERLLSKAVSIKPFNMTVNDLERRLRKGKYHIIGKIQHDRFLLDLRTIQDDEMDKIIEGVKAAITTGTAAEEKKKKEE